MWNVYNTLFDHLDMMRDQFCHKSIERTPCVTVLALTYQGILAIGHMHPQFGSKRKIE